MSERMLITKIAKDEQGRIGLYKKGDRYRTTLLFDASDLMTISIDPNTLGNGQQLAVRFWAIYELSKKINNAGNPYKNVIALEPINLPATSTSADNSTVVDELREIKNLLQYIAHLLEGQDLQPPAPSPQPPAPPPPTDPSLLDDPPTPDDDFADVDISEVGAPAPPDPALTVEQARRKFYSLTADAITLGAESQQINALIDVANKNSFAAALVQLENLLERITTK